MLRLQISHNKIAGAIATIYSTRLTTMPKHVAKTTIAMNKINIRQPANVTTAIAAITAKGQYANTITLGRTIP